MKEIGPIVIGLIVFTAILITMHQNGSLVGQSQNLTQNQALGPTVRGASTQNNGAFSPYYGDVDIDDVIEPGTFAGSEYIKLESSTDEPINITGWSIVSEITGNKAFIPNASSIPLVESEKPIIINGYQKIILSSGSSPIKISFRENICTGYIEEKNLFNPSLYQRCPNIDNGNLPARIEDSDQCMSYINSLQTCKTPKSFPNIPSYCEDFIIENASYGGCVKNYKNYKDFYRDSWRIFLNSKTPLWKREKDGKNNQESLQLLDAQGKIVDTFTY